MSINFGDDAISRADETYAHLAMLIQSLVYGLLIGGAIAGLYFLDAPAIWWVPIVVGVATVLCAHAVLSGTLFTQTQVKASTDYAVATNIAQLQELKDELQQIREEISARDV